MTLMPAACMNGATYGPCIPLTGRTAFAFNGTNQYMDAGSAASQELTTKGTIQAWIYPTGNGANPDGTGGVILSRAGEFELARFGDGSIRWLLANDSAAFDTRARQAYEADGNAIDAISGNSATWSGTPAYTAGQTAAQAFSFDGTNYLTLHSTGFADLSKGFSTSLWIYPQSLNSNERFFELGNGDGNENISLYRQSNTDDLTLLVRKGGQDHILTVPDLIEQYTWQHFAVVMQAYGSTTIFKNNVPVGYGNLVVPANVSRTQNYLAFSSGSEDRFQGRMGQIVFYDRRITAPELGLIYTNGLSMASSRYVDTGFIAPADTWTHLALTIDNGLVKTYANGSLVHTLSGTGPIGDWNTASDSLTIGGVAGSSRGFAGRIADVSVHNVVLDATAINQSELARGAALNLSAAYSFENNISNAAGTQTSGTFGSISRVVFTKGVSGSGMRFTGSSSQQIDLGTSLAITGTQSFAIETWVRTTNNHGTIITQNSSSNNSGYQLETDSTGRIVFSHFALFYRRGRHLGPH